MIGEEYIANKVKDDLYLQGEAATQQVRQRRKRGKLGRAVFVSATVLAVVLLLILLFTIVNQSLGLVAQESRIPERELLLAYNREQVLSAPNVVLATEDDRAIAAGVANDPNGLGFVPWAAYLGAAGNLNLVAIDGRLPNEESVASGQYPLTRPLFLGSSPAIVGAKPQVGAFLAYTHQHLAEVVPQAGYFIADQRALGDQSAAVARAMGLDELPGINPADYDGDIVISGSSTVAPLLQLMADRFTADGFRGQINIEPVGTTAGYQAFCAGNDAADLVAASRVALPTEYAACKAKGRRLIEALLAQDAIAVVVNPANTFAASVEEPQLQQLFTTAETWAEANYDWPADTINRYIPTSASGTTDFFVETVFGDQTLGELPKDTLVSAYVANVSHGRCRAVEREQRFYADQLLCEDPQVFAEVCAAGNPPTGCTLEPRDAATMIQLVRQDVIKPKVVATWTATDSILHRDEILATTAAKFPHAEVLWKRWLTWEFVTSRQSSLPETAGIRTAILGTLWVVGIATLFSFPLGVGAAVYLEEYANKANRLNRIIQTNINNLAGVPSIIYGLLGLAVFVRALEPLTSGAFFGAIDPGTSANGRTILSAGLTLGLLGLPVIIISSQEAIRAVPGSLRQASYGLGATKWQTIRSHVLPNAIAGILTGVILSMSRIIGETAPLVVIGASTFITTDPAGPFSKFTSLPSQIYQWTTRPQDAYRNLAAATIIVLLLLLFLLNAVAIYFRNRYSKRLG